MDGTCIKRKKLTLLFRKTTQAKNLEEHGERLGSGKVLKNR